ncbi:MAG: hypothetical protein AAFO77_13940 [Pseudomonadota bacterium]
MAALERKRKHWSYAATIGENTSRHENNTAARGNALLQACISVLDGPHGSDPAALIVGLSALAGHVARRDVKKGVSSGCLVDDFFTPANLYFGQITLSDQVTRLICDLTTTSFASIITNRLVAAGANWLPCIERDMAHSLMSLNGRDFPNYTVPPSLVPSFPVQRLLALFWTSAGGLLTCDHVRPVDNVTIVAHAVVEAAMMSGSSVPLDQAGQLALETAIAMSKVDVEVHV